MLTAVLIGGGVVVGAGVLFLIVDWFRSRRDVAKHLKRVAERKEAYEKFKEKRKSSEVKKQPAPPPPPRKK